MYHTRDSQKCVTPVTQRYITSVTQKIYHIRDSKKYITHVTQKMYPIREFLLSLRLLNIRRLKVSFSDSISKQRISQLHLFWIFLLSTSLLNKGNLG